MAQKTPVRLNFDGSGNLDGFAEFQASDFISLADGGTGASYASLGALRTGIGLAIGTNVQAFDADLTTLSNLTHADGSFIVSNGSQYILESGSTARTSLGLGTGDSPQFTSLTLTGNLDVRGEVVSTVSEVITIDDAFVKLNTGNSEVDSGIIVETSDSNDARLFYDVSNNRWVAGENNSYDELLTQTSTDTLTNKTISGSANTITNIGNSALSNSSFTVTDGSNSTAVSLGGTVTFTGGAGVDIAESSGTITFTADLSEILSDFNERVDDRVGTMVTAGSNVSLTYDDAAGTLTVASTDTNTQLTSEQVQDIVGAMFSSNTETNITATYEDSDGTIDLVSTDTQLTSEQVQDIVGAMFSSNTETNITATYEDGDGTIDLVADLLTEEAVEDFVSGMIVGGTNVTATYDDAGGTLTLASTDTNTQLTQEQVEDFVGGMLSGNTETLITVTYDDTNGKINYVVDNDLANYSNTNSAFITLASLSGGTGVTYNNGTGAISIGQAVATTSNVQFNNVQVDGVLTSNDITSSSISIDGNATITGNLTVEGTSTQVDSTTVTVADPLFKYAKDNTGNSVDIGFYGKYVQSSTTKYAGLAWDASQTDKFRLFHGNQTEPTTTVDTSGTGHTTGTLIANLEGNVTGNVTGNVSGTSGSTTGNAATATALASAQNFSLTGDITASAVSFDGSGAVALSTTITDDSVQVGNIDFLVDEDNMSSDSAVKVPTQQSVKAYVDSQIQTEESIEDFVAGAITAGTNVSVTYDDSAGTITIASTDTNTQLTQEQVEDFVGGMISGTQTFITVGYDDTNGDLTYVVPVKDEDNMASDSATHLATQQSIKAYVDSQVTAQDLDFQADSGGALAIDLDSETITFTGGTGIDTSGSGNAVTIAIDSTVVTESSTDTLTNKTINLEGNVVIVEYAVTVANIGGANKFLIDGEAQATISFRPGVVHRFDLSDNSTSGHPFKLSTTSNGSHNSGSEYTTGKTTNGSQGSAGAYLEYTVNAATPDILYYYCSSHSGMGGTITVFGSAYGDADVQSYLSAGTGITLSGSGVIATTITQYADSDVQSYLSAGSGITLSGSGVIASSITQYADSDVASYLSSNSYATQSYVTTQVNNLIDSAPGALNTLNELAAALGDDASFSTTITNSIATKLATSDFTSTANTWIGTKDSDDLSEGSTNLYYTNARVQSYLSGGSGITMSGSGEFSVDATSITGQSAYAGSVDTTNDFILIYDHSTTSLKKIAVSDLNAASGAGTMTSFTIAADSGSNQVVADSNTLTLTGGSGIDTSVGGTDEVTVALNTEAVQDIVGAMFSSNTETNITATYEDSDGTIDLVSTGNTTEQIQDIVGAMFTSNTETNITVTYQDSDGTIDLVSTADTTLTQEQVEDFAANVIVAGTNITKTYDDSAGTLTLAATGGAANAFSTIAVSGQSNVVADAATDTLTLVGGTGMTLTTNAGSDTITFASSGSSGGGTMPFTEFDGSTDDIILSSAATGGALPVTLAGGSSDPINMTATTQTLTSYADDDGDTKVEVERTSDNDTVHIKAGGTDVITATATGVTITNLTVSGTTTQANELKITDTLFELNADGGSLTTDAGMIVERGSTGDNAAFIWDESADSWVAGTTATDGSASSNLTVTEGDLKAKTQNQSNNSTKVATTAYVDTALGSLSSNSITDADSDTKIQVEESSDEDIIRADTAGQERLTIDNNVSMSARGGFYTHNATMHASETFTIASTEGTVAAGPLDVQGTVDVQGTLVVV